MKQVKMPSYLFWTLILSFIVVILIFILATKDGAECIGSPMTYGAEKALTSDSGSIFCYCSFSSPRYAPFYFNDVNISLDRELGS